MVRIAASFLLLSVISLAAKSGQVEACQSSAQSCQFYSCIESQYRCGDQGYMQRFGKPQCEKYLALQKFSSAGLKKWYPKVRECLQIKLAKGLANEAVDSCEDLKSLAFESHVPCYVETGFCELSYVDRFEYLVVIGSALLQPEVRKAGDLVNRICRSRHQSRDVQ